MVRLEGYNVLIYLVSWRIAHRAVRFELAIMEQFALVVSNLNCSRQEWPHW